MMGIKSEGDSWEENFKPHVAKTGEATKLCLFHLSGKGLLRVCPQSQPPPPRESHSLKEASSSLRIPSKPPAPSRNHVSKVASLFSVAVKRSKRILGRRIYYKYSHSLLVCCVHKTGMKAPPPPSLPERHIPNPSTMCLN